MPTSGASARRVLARGLAARCPACGHGHIFVRGVETRRACGVCGWRFERCPGHWIGGNEINLLATFPAGVVAFGLCALVFGPGAISVTFAVVASAAFSVAFYRPSRGLFFALDYLIDSALDASPLPPRLDDDGGGDGDRDERPWPDHRCGATPAPPAASSVSPSANGSGRMPVAESPTEPAQPSVTTGERAVR